MKRIWTSFAAVVAGVSSLTGLKQAAHAAVETSYPFQGVTLIHRTETSPRNLDIHIALIDLLAPGIRFKVTPESTYSGDGSGLVVGQSPRAFISDIGAQVGVNGDYYVAAGTYGGLPHRDPNAFAASDGDVYSSFSSFEPAFNIAANNVWTAIKASAQTPDGKLTPTPAVPVYNALGGYGYLVQNGALPTYWDNPDDYRYQFAHELHPRTVIGVNQSGTQAILFTVDGRQVSSGGMTFPEMGSMLLNDYGMYNAVNQDGGGGSTLFAVANPTPTTLNHPSDGSERPVSNNLAVFARPQPPPVPAGAITKNFQEQTGYSTAAAQLRSGQATTNANNNILKVGYDTSQGITRTVFSFDLSAIPVGSTINSASLALDNFDVAKGGGDYIDMSLYRLDADFDETQVTWNQRRTGVPWTIPGGDFSGIPLSTLFAQDSTGTDTFVNTVAFTQAAQAAIDAHRQLSLILLAESAEGATGNLYARFRSDEDTTAGAARPLLSIDYTPAPEPSSLMLLATAACAHLLARRRSRGGH